MHKKCILVIMEGDNMAKFAIRLRELRNSKSLSQQKLADYLKTSKSSVNMYERGEREPGINMLEAIADFFNVDLDYLLGKTDSPDKGSGYSIPKNVMPVPDEPVVYIPVIGRVAAGLNCLAEENVVDYEPVFRSEINPSETYVYLQVVGDSMYPELKEGDFVLVKCQDSVDSGSYAVVIVDNEDGVIKRIVYDRNYIELQSVNPMYPPRRFEGADVLRVRVFGLVKEIKRKF